MPHPAPAARPCHEPDRTSTGRRRPAAPPDAGHPVRAAAHRSSPGRSGAARDHRPDPPRPDDRWCPSTASPSGSTCDTVTTPPRPLTGTASGSPPCAATRQSPCSPTTLKTIDPSGPQAPPNLTPGSSHTVTVGRPPNETRLSSWPVPDPPDRTKNANEPPSGAKNGRSPRRVPGIGTASRTSRSRAIQLAHAVRVRPASEDVGPAVWRERHLPEQAEDPIGHLQPETCRLG